MIYVADYVSDFGKIIYQANLRVGLVSNINLSNSRGTFSATSLEFDNEYLPDTFKKNVRLRKGKSVECDTGITKRFGKIYISTTEYLKVELPFLPNTSNFDQFMIDAYYHNINTIVSLGYEGEFYPAYRLRLLR